MIASSRLIFIGIFLASIVPASAGADKMGGWRGASPPFASPNVSLSAADPDASDASAAADAKPAPAPAQTRQQKLDDLFARLAASSDAAETNGLIFAIDRLQLESGSETGDFLMARAIAAMGAHELQVSRSLLDKLIALRPDWAEAWNKRVTVRYLMDDEKGSMADIARVLVLEPRHFGALSGMGMILERGGFSDEALRAYRRALEIAPQLASVRAAVDRLTAAVKGQSL
jgi:tetratricopeptide (TPR) repeat protein